MKKNIKAVFFDIDGTLRSFSTCRIPDSAKEAIQLARNAGIKVFIATGRHQLEIEEEGLLEGLEFDGFVTLNGQYCYDQQGIIYDRPIEPGQIEEMLRLLEQKPFPCLFMEANTMYINLADERVIRVQSEIATAMPPIGSLEHVRNRSVYQMVIYVDSSEKQWIMDHLEGCDITEWLENRAYDINPSEGSKCRGIEAVLNYYGISREEAAAVGDGYNDVSMLAYAGIGIAMGNGCEEAKAAADHVTGDVEEDGLLQAVHYLIN